MHILKIYSIPFIVKDTENWSKQFSYTKLQVAMERKQAKMDNPLKIDEEDILINLISSIIFISFLCVKIKQTKILKIIHIYISATNNR